MNNFEEEKQTTKKEKKREKLKTKQGKWYARNKLRRLDSTVDSTGGCSEARKLHSTTTKKKTVLSI